MPLVVVRASPVLREVERIDRRAEERLADVVHRLRQRVGDAVAAPSRRPLHERDVQPVVVRTRPPRSTGCCSRSSGSAGSRCCVPAATQVGTFWLIGHDQVQAAQVLVADADRASRSPSCCSTSTLACAGVGVLQVPIHRREVDERRPMGRRRSGCSGNTGAPACVGRQADADLAQAARGRSCCRPTAARWPPRAAARGRRTVRRCRARRVRRDSNGDQAKPRRGETLFVSVSIVSRNCRS